MKNIFVVICFAFLTVPVTSQVKLAWSTSIDKLGSFSSPRATDLNGDGILDIVLGAGRREFIPTDSSIIALDGRTGVPLWTAHSHDQVFGSPSFMDISGDGVDDVFINGRSGVLKALNGKNGTVIWDFMPGYGPFKFRAEGWYNFYNPQFITDIDNDGVKDIVISNGGDVNKAAGDPNRPPGYIALISGKEGKLIKRAKVPDGRETYCSVVVYDFNLDGNPSVVFGTGGETIQGSLYITTIKDLLSGDISNSKKIATSSQKGFIAPPVLADINADATPDIITMAVDGRMIAINGKTLSQIWSTRVSEVEAYSSLAVGRFNADDTPDFFTTVNTGIWPKSEFAKSLIVDGKSGQIIQSDTIGFYQISSPAVFDVDGDEYDEVIMASNYPQWDEQNGKNRFINTLLIFDFKNKVTQRLGPIFQGSNGTSTPWIGDIDNNGMFDIISLYQTNIYNESIVSGFNIFRLDTDLKVGRKVSWGSYMGSNYDGIYIDNRHP